MSFWNKIFGRRSSGSNTPTQAPQVDQAIIDELERQLLLSPDYDIVDGLYTGEKAEQWFGQRGMHPPDTQLPLNVVDTSQVRFSDEDKNLPARLDAVRKLARTRSRQAVEVLEKANFRVYNEVVERAIRHSLKDITIREMKRQGGHNYVKIYKRMSSDQDCMPSVLELFDNGCIFYLGMTCDRESINFLRQLIVAEDSDVRLRAVSELVRLGRKYGLPEISQILIDALQTNPSPDIRCAAAKSLGDLVYSVYFPMEYERELFGWTSSNIMYDSVNVDGVKESATKSLGNYTISDVFSILLPYLLDPDAKIRGSAIETCQKVRDALVQESYSKAEEGLTSAPQNYPYNQEEIDILQRALNDSDPRICAFAGRALQVVGVMDEVSSLLALLRIAPDAAIRRQIALDLGPHNDSRSIKELRKMLTDSDEFVRINAARSLSQIGDESDISIIQNAMRSAGRDVHHYFIDAISTLRQRHGKT